MRTERNKALTDFQILAVTGNDPEERAQGARDRPPTQISNLTGAVGVPACPQAPTYCYSCLSRITPT